MSKQANTAAVTEEERAELIERASYAVETTREPDDIERAPAVPPRQSNQIEIEGLSLAEAFRHPAVRNALEVYHDLIEHSKNDPPELGWGGIAQAFLAIACFKAGHPLRGMPAPNVAARTILDRHNQHIGPELVAAFRAAPKRGLFGLISPVITGTTIFSRRVLLAEAVGIRKSIVSLWSKEKPTGAGVAQFEDFAQKQEKALAETAVRFNPDQGAKFLTFSYKRMFGEAMDWLKAYVSNAQLPVDDDPDDDGPHPDAETIALVNRVWGGTGFFGASGTGRVPSELPEKAEMACGADLRGKNLRDTIESIAQKADLDRRQRLILNNMVTREKSWKDLAREWNLSGARMTALKDGTKKKLRGVLIPRV